MFLHKSASEFKGTMVLDDLMHPRIEFGRSRTGEGSSGGRKRGVV